MSEGSALLRASGPANLRDIPTDSYLNMLNGVRETGEKINGGRKSKEKNLLREF